MTEAQRILTSAADMLARDVDNTAELLRLRAASPLRAGRKNKPQESTNGLGLFGEAPKLI